MSPPESELRGFKVVFVTVGLAYALMASSALVRGVGMLRDFAVPEAMVASPVLGDFFSACYEFMAFVGLLMVLFGLVTQGRRAQRLVSGVFCASNLLFAARDSEHLGQPLRQSPLPRRGHARLCGHRPLPGPRLRCAPGVQRLAVTSGGKATEEFEGPEDELLVAGGGGTLHAGGESAIGQPRAHHSPRSSPGQLTRAAPVASTPLELAPQLPLRSWR